MCLRRALKDENETGILSFLIPLTRPSPIREREISGE